MKPRQGLRFLKSLHTRSRKDQEILDWISERRSAVNHTINKIDVRDLRGWNFNSREIAHSSGKFFQIQYLKADMNGSQWDQPIINQPEIGILGFIVREIDGCLHFLVQAKIEPGNINIVQLSPTVQSTKSNFTKVHGGALTPFVEYFLNEQATILVDQLQSEQGARFFQKRNRNIIIEVDEDLNHTDYIWMTLGDIVSMSKYPNTVNMDSRTVISCIHFGSFDERNFEVGNYMGASTSPWIYSILRRDVYIHSIPDILSKITNLRFRREVDIQRVDLFETQDWDYREGSVSHKEGKYFDVSGYEIFIENRESKSWTQPMVCPKSHGICCFFAKREGGVYYLLVQLKDEIGSFDGVEMAPTIQTSIENLESSIYFSTFNKISGIKKRVLLDVMQSEEGGRFYQEQNRNIILDITDHAIDEFPGYVWMTVHQIKTFLQYNNYVNIQTRSIISSLPI